MAFNVGEFFAKLSLDYSDFASGLAAAQAQAAKSSIQMGAAFKDMGRIAGGILMSQAFYTVLRTVKDATKAALDFTSQMQQADIAFSTLLGNESRAKQFLNTLEDFAAKTPFTMQTAMDSSRRLLAAGFQVKDVVPILQSLSDATAVSGVSDDVLQRMVTSISQIKATGKVSVRELRELANAGIPVFDILQQKLHLTAKEMANLGKVDIPAGTAIGAILQGLTERYSGAAAKMQKTVKGAWSTITDSLKLISKDILMGAANKLGVVLDGIGQKLTKYRNIMRQSGIGGLINYIVPPGMQTPLRLFIGLMGALGHSVLQVIIAMKPFAGALLEAGVHFGNALLPGLIVVLQALTKFMNIISSCQPLLRGLIYSITFLGLASKVSKYVLLLTAAIKGLEVSGFVAGAVGMLSKSIQWLAVVCTKNPIIATMMLIAGSIAAIGASSAKADTWLGRLMQKIGALMGFNTSQILQPIDPKGFDQSSKDWQDYVDGVSSGLDNLGDSMEDSKKKANDWVASFDEVFSMAEDKDNKDSLAGLGGAFKLPQMPTIDPENFKLPDDKNTGLDWWKGIWLPLLPWIIKFLQMLVKKVKDWWDDFNNWWKGRKLKAPEVEPIKLPELPAFPVFPPLPAPKVNPIPPIKLPALPSWPILPAPAQEPVPQLKLPPLPEWPALPAPNFSPVTVALGALALVVVSKFGEMTSAAKAFAMGLAPAMIPSVDNATTQVGNYIGHMADSTDLRLQQLLDGTKKWAQDMVPAADLQPMVDANAKALQAMGTDHESTMSAVEARQKNDSDVLAFEARLDNPIAQLKQSHDKIYDMWNQHSYLTETQVDQMVTKLGPQFRNLPAMDQLKLFQENASSEWDKHASNTLGIVGGMIFGIGGLFAAPAFLPAVAGAGTQMGNSVANWWDPIYRGLVNIGNNISNFFANLRPSFGVKMKLPDFSSLINSIGLGSLAEMGLGWLSKVSGSTWLPQLANGGVAMGDTIARIGEGKKKEMVAPLSEATLAPFAKMIADNIPGQGTTTDTRPIMYVGTLIADDRGLRELNRKMEIIKQQESGRRA